MEVREARSQGTAVTGSYKQADMGTRCCISYQCAIHLVSVRLSFVFKDINTSQGSKL